MSEELLIQKFEEMLERDYNGLDNISSPGELQLLYYLFLGERGHLKMIRALRLEVKDIFLKETGGYITMRRRNIVDEFIVRLGGVIYPIVHAFKDFRREYKREEGRELFFNTIYLSLLHLRKEMIDLISRRSVVYEP